MVLMSEFRVRARLPGRALILEFPFLRVDEELNCIKGGGGCHLREKVLAEAAETCVSRTTLYELIVMTVLVSYNVPTDFR